MCLILFTINPTPKYKLILAANRDEFYDRPAEPAAFWKSDPDLLAGKDLKKGGTWLGITKSGRFAAITNFKLPGEQNSLNRSRGELVLDFLLGDISPKHYLKSLKPIQNQYNGFNLIIGTPDKLYFTSNHAGEDQVLEKGYFGLSNEKLNCEWPKVEFGREKMRALIERKYSKAGLYELLADQGNGDDFSASFLKSETYGTRAMTILTIDYKNRVTFEEKTYTKNGDFEDKARFEFRI